MVTSLLLVESMTKAMKYWHTLLIIYLLFFFFREDELDPNQIKCWWWKTKRRCGSLSLKYLHQSDSKIGIKMVLPMGRSGFFTRSFVAIKHVQWSLQKSKHPDIIILANIIPSNPFSSSSCRVLFKSFCPQNISLLPNIVAEAHA